MYIMLSHGLTVFKSNPCLLFLIHKRLHNIENESSFEYYALLWSPLFLAGVFFAVLLTIIVSIILKMNHILNIMPISQFSTDSPKGVS